MKVTAALFEAHLRCHTKSKLYSEPAFEAGAGALRARGESSETSEFVQQASDNLLAEFSPEQCHVGNPSLQAVAAKRYSLIVNYAVDQADIHAQIHALVLARIAKELSDVYIPVRFVPGNTVTTIDRLRLAFDAVAIHRALGEKPRVGRIIHGGCRTVLAINLSGLVERVLLTCAQIEAQNLNPTPPPLVLNRHCGECEFQSRCRQIAIEKDDLSLLRNMTAKERGKLNDKGIFTVTQLSYTFRPRKVMALKHHHSLKALAVRTKQIHVLGDPTFAIPGTAVFFDVEGDGNAGFYYLIGLNYGVNDSQARRSFWADDKSQEGTIWSLFLSALCEIEKPILIHYGAYEAEFLRKMRDRYPGAVASSFVDELIANALNVLSLTYSQIYFPTYSNSLKDIAGYIGFQWSTYGATGRTASEWRSAWNSSRDPGLKQQLITYNTEDCVALRKVSEAIMSVISEDPPRIGDVEAVKVGPLTSDYPRQFGEVAFVLPEFKEINKAAYWDYQRDRVYIRSSSRLKHIATRGTKGKFTRPTAINKVVQVVEERPTTCMRCEGKLIYKTGRFSETVYDLRFSATGLRRWVVRFRYDRYICWSCKASFNQYERQGKWGSGLKAYVIYQIVELRIAQHAIARSLRTLFQFDIRAGSINCIKSGAAEEYLTTYQAILRRLAAGRLVHADETQVKIRDKAHYVWVFTSFEEVAFVYSETRDAKTPRDILSGFQGVLVSDFYAGYDLMPCAQQKCLIHLMRDINDDLRRHPFDNEMQELGKGFASLLRPIIDTVDRFGLTARYLRKHLEAVEQFYDALAQRGYESETAAGYKRRFEKNRLKLFTFLEHDGVPWNNNNAEHAIKAFARLRNLIGAKSSQKGIRDYLVLLSISETCRYKGMDFLEVLRSGGREGGLLVEL